MKEEYDFSKGKRGKFYRPNAKLNLPVYLDPDVLDYLLAKAKARGIAVNEMVNDLLRKDIMDKWGQTPLTAGVGSQPACRDHSQRLHSTRVRRNRLRVPPHGIGATNLTVRTMWIGECELPGARTP
ncbi:MAG: hypothetical protein ACREBU_13625 [Nitrososphaera sp.]